MIDDISIRYVEGFSPDNLRSPVMIEGLPGIGQVGKLVAEYMIHMLGAEKIAEIHSIYFPPHVIIEENGVARLTRNELHIHRGENRDIVFLTGDYQSTSNEGHYLLTDMYLDIAAELKVTRVFTLGGFGVGHFVEEPRVFGAVNHPETRKEIEAAGVIFQRDEAGGGIVGAAGLMLGMGALRGINSICLMGETSGYIVDPRSAAAVLAVLTTLLGITVDGTQLNDRAAEMEKVIESLVENERIQKDEELSYIG
ncbi:MAG: PAC2 family protein [Methanoregula sp. PtaU1.Bin051]|nr:MAG: PAC2 family protein [Methanoregula sp. PtaU1.Bin051]